MKKKGFTLVELIAVIVILTVVGMISIPIVVQYIERSRVESYKVSVDNVMKLASEYVVKEEENNDFPVGGINVKDSNLDLKKEKIISGIIKRNEDGVIEVENMYDGTYCASGRKNQIIVKKVNSEEECTGIDTTPPDLKVKINNVTESSITVVAIAKDSLSKIKGYEYCIGNECTDITNKNNYTFKDLRAGTEYEIKVRAKNENSGLEGYPIETTDSEEIIRVKTNGIEGAIFKISSSSYSQKKDLRIIYPKGKYEKIYEVYDLDYNLIKREETNEEEVVLDIEENCIVRAIVKLGNEEIENEIYIVGIDQRGPEVVVIMKDSWEKTKQIEVISKDETGIATNGYSYDGGKSWSKNNRRTYQNNTRVKLLVRDKLGNITDRYKICTDKSETNCHEADEIVIDKIDNAAPICSLKVVDGLKGNNNWYLSQVTVDFDIVRDIAIDPDGREVEGSGVESQNIEVSKFIDEGRHKAIGIVTDKVGNTGRCELDVNIALTKPKLDTTVSNNPAPSQEVTMKIEDDVSGIDSYYFGTLNPEVVDVPWVPTDQKLIKPTITEPGDYYFGVKNKAGLITVIKYTFYKTIFNVRGQGTVNPNYYITLAGNKIAFPTPSMSGHYNYNGWSLSGNATSGVTSAVINSNNTYYVALQPKIYTIYFNANGGSVSEGSRSGYYGNAVGTLPTPVRSGYRFDGWYTPEGYGLSASSVYSANIIVIARWTPLEGYATFHFDVHTCKWHSGPYSDELGNPFNRYSTRSEPITLPDWVKYIDVHSTLYFEFDADLDIHFGSCETKDYITTTPSLKGYYIGNKSKTLCVYHMTHDNNAINNPCIWGSTVTLRYYQ